MRKLITLFFPLCILFFVLYSYAGEREIVASQVINVIVDGEAFPGISIYKMLDRTRYFSIKEIARVYNATIEWKSTSSYAIIRLNSRKINIKVNSSEVIFEKKLKKMSLPSRLIKDDIYLSPEIITSKEFAEIVKADTKWNAVSLALNITHHINISAIKYFTKSDNTQILVQLKEPLPYAVSKISRAVVVKIVNGYIRRGFININNSTIKNVQYSTKGRFAIIRINFKTQPKLVETTMFSKPDRISIDITHSDIADFKKNLAPDLVGENVVQSDSLREFDLTSSEKYREAQINDTASVIKSNKDLENISTTKFENRDVIDDATARDISLEQTNKSEESCECRVIVLDAGHGGEDSGAIGPSGTKEKDINLEIVRELKSIFDNNNGYKIILTRKDDTFIPLTERANIANENKADLFISIHCNANLDRSANGFEIYFLSEKATDSEAAATAVLENSVLELEENSNNKRHAALLNDIFRSMIVTECMNESSELCGFIAFETYERLKIPNRGVKQAGFYVLKGTKMPAVLVESAFISNYVQESKLCSKEFRIAVADSIYEGVVKYYAKKDQKRDGK